jgi:hypothetical protein
VVEQPQLTAHEEAKWRAEFKRLGVIAVREQVGYGGFPPDRRRELAKRWLREQEAAAESQGRWTLIAAVVAAAAAVVTIGLMLKGCS